MTQPIQQIVQRLHNTVDLLSGDIRNEQIPNADGLLKQLGIFAEKLTAISSNESPLVLPWCYRWVKRMNAEADIWALLYKLESGPQYLADITEGYNQLATLLGAELVTLRPPKVHLTALHVEQFSVFSDLSLTFSPGLNVFLGENGSGKTHLIKLAFTLCRALNTVAQDPAMDLSTGLTQSLTGVFGCQAVGQLVRFSGNKSAVHSTFKSAFDTEQNRIGFKFASISHQVVPEVAQVTPTTKTLRALFIPTKEVISIYPGFLSLFAERRLAFDETYRDIMQALDKLPLVSPPPLYDALKAILSEHIQRELKLTDQGFVVTQGNRDLPASLEAEGIRKILMLLYLVQNGEISEDTLVFWDEPEANVNSKLLTVLAALLAEMAKRGVQVFLATHSLFLMKELNLLTATESKIPMTFFNLYFQDGQVIADSADRLEDVQHITALDSALEQFERKQQALSGKIKVPESYSNEAVTP